jgi:hypothetical protein
MTKETLSNSKFVIPAAFNNRTAGQAGSASQQPKAGHPASSASRKALGPGVRRDDGVFQTFPNSNVSFPFPCAAGKEEKCSHASSWNFDDRIAART